jgi:hypothetical protein
MIRNIRAIYVMRDGGIPVLAVRRGAHLLRDVLGLQRNKPNTVNPLLRGADHVDTAHPRLQDLGDAN